MQSRRFHRVTFNTACVVTHHDIAYSGCVENLSLRGALISSDQCIMIPDGESCRLAIPVPGSQDDIVVTAEVVHSFFSMIGVKFVEFVGDSESHLYGLMQRISQQPDLLRHEWDEILAHKERIAV
jgi:hypothetical protein